MRIKTFILLLCLGLVLSSVAWADVDSVFFTINSNGQIIEAGTSGTDADPELLQELAEQSQDTSEEPLVVAPETEEESAPVVPSLRGLENTSSGTGDEDDNITDTDGETESDSNELNPCEAAGGTGDVSNCICESGGTFMLGNDDIYRCCKDNAPYVLDDRAYSAVPLIPQCGCNAPSIWGMTLREPYMDGAEKVCCRGKNRVWSSQMGTTGYQEELDEDNCGCPAAAEGATAIIGKTTSNGFYCCQGSKYLQDKKSWQISYTYCGCSDNQAKCATQAMCEAAVQEYDKNWFWCETEKKCVTQGYDCACPAGQEKENGQCVKVCSEQYPELCSDVVACLRAQGNWCYVITDGTVSDNWVEIGENLAESTGVIEECRRDPCCPDGQQQAADGQCYSCPNDGMLFYQASDEEEGTYICCKTTDDTPEPAGQVYDSTNKIWRYDSACGCPIINNKAGENKEGICCYNGYALETKNNVTDYSSADYFSVCDCPDDGVWMESTKVCCKAGKPFDSTTQTYASTRDLAKCGCISEEETEVRSGNNTFCCKEGRVVIPTDVTPVPDVGVCQCGSNTPVWDSTQNMCVKCLTNNHCSGATPRCYTDSEHPENNTCVACTNDSECGENLICDSTSKTCVACAEGFYQRGACRECLQDEHCQGRTDGKNYCDPDTLTCETCVLHSSTSHADAGCDPNKKYCVSSYVTAEGQTKSQRLCSQCVSNTDCTGGQKCNLTMGKCVDPCPNGMVPDAQGTCPELGECDPNSATPVWDI